MKKKRETVGDGELDPRFAAARTDPRFQRFPKSQRKVEIDERFAGIFLRSLQHTNLFSRQLGPDIACSLTCSP